MRPTAGAFFYITDESGRITTNKNELYAMDTYKCTRTDAGTLVHYAPQSKRRPQALDLPQLEATIEAHNAAWPSPARKTSSGARTCPYLDTYNGIWIV